MQAGAGVRSVAGWAWARIGLHTTPNRHNETRLQATFSQFPRRQLASSAAGLLPAHTAVQDWSCSRACACRTFWRCRTRRRWGMLRNNAFRPCIDCHAALGRFVSGSETAPGARYMPVFPATTRRGVPEPHRSRHHHYGFLSRGCRAGSAPGNSCPANGLCAGRHDAARCEITRAWYSLPLTFQDVSPRISPLACAGMTLAAPHHAAL